jgi:hypothetical protein
MTQLPMWTLHRDRELAATPGAMPESEKMIWNSFWACA